VANLGPEPVRASFEGAGAPIFTLGDVPARAGDGTLGPWSVGWFLDA
jgi:hypothetical protein